MRMGPKMTPYKSGRGPNGLPVVLCGAGMISLYLVLILYGINVINHLPRDTGGKSATDKSISTNETITLNSTSTTPELIYPPPMDLWAGGYQHIPDHVKRHVRSLLTDAELREVEELCGRCLYHSLVNYIVGKDLGHYVFVATGDIEAMWIRDSAVQIGIYFPLLKKHPALRLVIEGAIRTQAFFIIQDPYANSYSNNWRSHKSFSKQERMLGRGAYVATRNYELDSGGYYISLLYNYYSSPDVFAAEQFLRENLVWDAINLMVDTWIIEQQHELLSRYRYSELPRDGRGPETGYTGMTWSGFRPSDDPNEYGYSIPSNMYAVGALEKALIMNENIWKRDDFHEKVTKLIQEITQGIEKFGIVEIEPGVQVYAYEVDGLGNNITDFDDANIPSLLSIPFLGYQKYNVKVYEETRRRLLSEKNAYFFKGQDNGVTIQGIGSPHTPPQYIWPLSLVMQALTTHNAHEQVRVIRYLLKMQCGNGLLHESVDVNNLSQCTRPYFEWANSMFVTLVSSILGLDCDEASEKQRLELIRQREVPDTSFQAQNGGGENPLYYENLITYMKYDAQISEYDNIVTFNPQKFIPKEEGEEEMKAREDYQENEDPDVVAQRMADYEEPDSLPVRAPPKHP